MPAGHRSRHTRRSGAGRDTRVEHIGGGFGHIPAGGIALTIAQRDLTGPKSFKRNGPLDTPFERIF